MTTVHVFVSLVLFCCKVGNFCPAPRPTPFYNFDFCFFPNMSEVDQLKAAFAKLTDDFQQMQTQMQQPAAGAVAPAVHVVYAPRKLSKFDGNSEQLEDWLLEAKSAVEAQSLTGKKAGDFLLNHLEGSAKLEIKYAGDDRDDPDKIYELLRKAFGDKSNKIQCFDNFRARKQGERESLQDFSHGLMTLLEKARNKDPNCVADYDTALRDNFAEKVWNDQLRWELNNRISDDPELTFNQIRERASAYTREVPSGPVKQKAVSRAVMSNQTEPWQKSLLDLLETQGEQQKLILKQQEELFKHFHGTGPKDPNSSVLQNNPGLATGSQLPFSSQGGARPKNIGPCYKCHEMGHFQRNCPMKQPPVNSQDTPLNRRAPRP
jgi:DNA-binding protein YbaB